MLEVYQKTNQWREQLDTFCLEAGNDARPEVTSDGKLKAHQPGRFAGFTAFLWTPTDPIKATLTSLQAETSAACRHLPANARQVETITDIDSMSALQLSQAIDELRRTPQVQFACLNAKMDTLLADFVEAFSETDEPDTAHLEQACQQLLHSAKTRYTILADPGEQEARFCDFKMGVSTKLENIDNTSGTPQERRAKERFVQIFGAKLREMSVGWEGTAQQSGLNTAEAIQASIEIPEASAKEQLFEELGRSKTAIARIDFNHREYPSAREMFTEDFQRLQERCLRELEETPEKAITQQWLQQRLDLIVALRNAMYPAVYAPMPDSGGTRNIAMGRGQINPREPKQLATAYAYGYAYARSMDYFLLRPLPEDKAYLKAKQAEWLAVFEHIRNNSEHADSVRLPHVQYDDSDILGELVPEAFRTSGQFVSSLFEGARLKDTQACVFIGINPDKRHNPPACLIVKSNGKVDQITMGTLGLAKSVYDTTSELIAKFSGHHKQAKCLDDYSRPAEN